MTATGALTYLRGAVSSTSTTAKTGAASGAKLTLGARALSPSAFFAGGICEIDLFTGALSNAEALNVMAGHHLKWTST
jgi:hypothetical protein